MCKNVEVIMPKKDMILGENGTLVPKKKRVCAYCRVSTDDIEQNTPTTHRLKNTLKKFHQILNGNL